ncbi:MAG TPA: DUF1648 domain-containing protein [Lacunisphaera sp.]|nr:DUF1648 domain-containing protein [Lacunisphaera sp.]
MKGPPQVIFLALGAIALGQSIWQHGRLPERVAAHFNASGEADGYLSRGLHTAWHLATVLFLTALFQGIAVLQARLPKDYVNLPHRDYWLAPGRAAATHDWIASLVHLLGSAVLVFFIALFHLLYQANLNPPPRLGAAVWWLAGTLLAAVAAALAALAVKFGRKPVA